MFRDLITVIVLICALSACRDRDSKPVSDQTIYVEHKIRGEEGADFVTVLLQFRKGASGKNEIVQAPGSVQLDGQLLNGDSSEVGGGFYELRLPLNGFGGIHLIRFDNGRGQVFTDSFGFKTIVVPELAPIEAGSDWKVALPNLQDGDRLTVALTDTAFYTNDIVQMDTVRKGGIVLPFSKLKVLKGGPLLLELSFIQSKPPAKGLEGIIEVEYSVKREVIKSN
jgi:hypothetical protein